MLLLLARGDVTGIPAKPLRIFRSAATTSPSQTLSRALNLNASDLAKLATHSSELDTCLVRKCAPDTEMARITVGSSHRLRHHIKKVDLIVPDKHIAGQGPKVPD